MPIVINGFSKRLPNGRFTGKLAWQNQIPKAQQPIPRNMANLEKALLEGKLKDADGNTITPDEAREGTAVIRLYCTVRYVEDAGTDHGVDEFENVDGSVAHVELDEEDGEDEPF